MNSLPINLPRVLHGLELPAPEIMKIVQKIAKRHFEEGTGEDGELSSECFPICASPGAVMAHVDTFGGEENGKLIYGLVLKSEGHVLHTDAMKAAGITLGFPLHPGTIYELHPYDRHWTETTTPGGELIFAASFIPAHDVRFGDLPKMAHDLRWEVMARTVEWKSREDRRAAEERERYRIA